MSLSVRLNPTIVVVSVFLALLFMLTAYLVRDETHERSLKSISGRLVQTKRALETTENKLNTALDVEKKLQNELRELEQEYAGKQRASAEELEAARTINRTLAQDMEKLKVRHGESLAAQRKNAGQALAAEGEEHRNELERIGRETQAKLDEIRQSSAQQLERLKVENAESLAAEHEQAAQVLVATEQGYRQKLEQVSQETQENLTAARQSAIVAQEQLDAVARKNEDLVEEVNAVNGVLQNTRVQHAAQVQELSETLAYYRTALEGSDPARARQLTSLSLEAQQSREALTQTRRDQQAQEVEYEKRLADADLIRTQTQSALEQTHLNLDASADQFAAARAALTLARGEAAAEIERLSELREQDQVEAAQAQQEIAALNRMLDNEKTAARQSLATQQQAHAEELQQARAGLEAAEQRLSDTLGELEIIRQEAEVRRQAAEKEYMLKMEQAEAEVVASKRALAAQETEAARTLEALHREYAQSETHLESQLTGAERRLEQSEQAYSSLDRLHDQFAELNGQYTERGMRLTVSESELQFPGGKATLPTEEIESLDRIAGFLKENTTLGILVEGHTDSAGGESFNLRLSQKRADAVKAALVGLGVQENRIQAKGVGEEKPIASNQTYDGRRQNRRVEIFIIGG